MRDEMDETKTTTIRLPYAIWKYIKRYCVDHDTTIGQFVIDAVNEKLRKPETKMDMKGE
jgi:macrodomain Ter protein organizer (MatP/YcbG family)